MLKIGVLLGDDIGLEVVPEAVKVMKAAAKATGLELQWQELPIGKRGHELHGHTMPQVTVQALEKMDGFLCGPIGHATYPRNDPTWIMPPLRKRLDSVLAGDGEDALERRRSGPAQFVEIGEENAGRSR